MYSWSEETIRSRKWGQTGSRLKMARAGLYDLHIIIRPLVVCVPNIQWTKLLGEAVIISSLNEFLAVEDTLQSIDFGTKKKKKKKNGGRNFILW